MATLPIETVRGPSGRVASIHPRQLTADAVTSGSAIAFWRSEAYGRTPSVAVAATSAPRYCRPTVSLAPCRAAALKVLMATMNPVAMSTATNAAT